MGELHSCGLLLLRVILTHTVCHLSDKRGGFPGGANGKEPTCQCRRHKRHRFDPWVRKIPWRRAWKPTLAFLPGESLGQRSLASYSPWGHKESDALKWFNTHIHTHIDERERNVMGVHKVLREVSDHHWIQREIGLHGGGSIIKIIIKLIWSTFFLFAKNFHMYYVV